MSKIRTCICCGKTYSYCPSCDNGPSWKMLYDTEKCKDIMNIVSGYNMKIISKNQTIESLNKLNIDNNATYNENVATTLKELSQIPVEKSKKRRKKR